MEEQQSNTLHRNSLVHRNLMDSPWGRWAFQLVSQSNTSFGFVLRTLYCHALRWSQKYLLSDPDEVVYLLGKRYETMNTAFLDDWHSRFLLTYRTGFSPLEGNFTTDQGWGCSLRVVQMLMAQAFCSVIFGRNWRSPPHGDPREREMMKELFLDTPAAVLSLHNLCAIGISMVKKCPGEWYGPNTAAKVAHCVLQSRPHKLLQTVLFDDGVINPTKVQDALEDGAAPCLLLVCTKLGAEDRIDEYYVQGLRKVFTLPWFQGMCSGDSATSAHFFIGISETAGYYLDPHTTRPALIDQLLDCNEWHPSMLTAHGVLRLPFGLLNTSCTFGFLITDELDLQAFFRALEEPLLSRIFDINALPHRMCASWDVDDEDTSLVLL